MLLKLKKWIAKKLYAFCNKYYSPSFSSTDCVIKSQEFNICKVHASMDYQNCILEALDSYMVKRDLAQLIATKLIEGNFMKLYRCDLYRENSVQFRADVYIAKKINHI